MAEIRNPSQSLRFGSFELDLQTGELRKAGVLVSLQEQSLRVLLALLERPGELVSREHLHQRLWPDGTFVDFDHGLNAIINRLRDTLGDSADTPRLIETLPRRGYRFIGSIDRLDRGGASERSAPVFGAPRVYDFGRFRLDAAERLLLCDSHPVTLTPKAFDLLVYLVERPGRLVEKSTLMSVLWPHVIVEEANLAFQISALRKVLDDDRSGESIIQTVPTRGYRFIGDVTRAIPPLKEEAADTKASAEGTRRYSRVVWPAVVLTLAISVALGLYLYRFRPAPPGPLRAIPLTTLPGKERYPSFSPEGDRIAFVWDGEKGDNDDIYVKVIGTEVPFRLTTSPAADGYPEWSPDGRHIAYFRATTKGSELFVIPALGGPERKIHSRLSSLGHCSGTMSWSPDAQLLAIADRGDQITCSIFLLSIETLQKRKLTSPPDSSGGDYAPAFSPDGRTIAFNRFGPAGGIYVVPAAGGDPERVTLEQNFWHGRVAWLPTGRELLFSSSNQGDRDPDNSHSLWRVSASRGTPERLGVGGDNAANPAVSPRGNRLAYEQRHLDANIWRIALPRSSRPAPAPSQLIASSRSDGAPHVSPDGARIAFLSDRSGTEEIWLCDTAGSNLVQLTSSGGATPKWSPDSRHLAFERVNGPAGINVISADGGPPRQVTTDPAAAVLPSWSSDGRWIYFGSSRTGRFEVWKVRAEGGRAVQVTKRGGFQAVESGDGTFVYYTKAFDVGGLWKVPVNGGEETAVLDFPKASFWGYWALVNDGIYFVDAAVSSRPALRFFDFGTGPVSDVMALEEKPIPHWPGMALSPDRKWLLYTQEDHRSGDIMLVDNFH